MGTINVRNLRLMVLGAIMTVFNWVAALVAVVLLDVFAVRLILALYLCSMNELAHSELTDLASGLPGYRSIFSNCWLIN